MLTPRKIRLMLFSSIIIVVASLLSISVLLKLPQVTGPEPLPTLAALLSPTAASVALSSDKDVEQNAPNNTDLTIDSEEALDSSSESAVIEVVPILSDLGSQESASSFVRLSNFVEEVARRVESHVGWLLV